MQTFKQFMETKDIIYHKNPPRLAKSPIEKMDDDYESVPSEDDEYEDEYNQPGSYGKTVSNIASIGTKSGRTRGKQELPSGWQPHKLKYKPKTIADIIDSFFRKWSNIYNPIFNKYKYSSNQLNQIYQALQRLKSYARRHKTNVQSIKEDLISASDYLENITIPELKPFIQRINKFISYLMDNFLQKHAETVDEIDWRPTEEIPEDYYAF